MDNNYRVLFDHIEAQDDLRKKFQTGLFRRMQLLVITCLISLFLWLTLFAPQAHAMSLKDSAIISDSFIKLGDLFYDLPRDGNKVLGAAPRPGSQMVLNARTLMRVAIALDLPWRPASSADHIVLRRSATLIDHETITDGLRDAISEKGMSGLFDLEFTQGSGEMILPAEYPPEFEIISLDIDYKNDRFKAHIAAPSNENPIRTNILSGVIEHLIQVPVLRDPIRNGRILHKNDIEFVNIPEHKINHDTVLDPSELYGMTPRRMILANKPITIKDIEAPTIIKRGEYVTMIFENGPLLLTAQGKALQSGGKGDTIRVVNDNSSRTIQAMISNTKEVRVIEQ